MEKLEKLKKMLEKWLENDKIIINHMQDRLAKCKENSNEFFELKSEIHYELDFEWRCERLLKLIND